jgi:hypothetical protein
MATEKPPAPTAPASQPAAKPAPTSPQPPATAGKSTVPTREETDRGKGGVDIVR